MSLMITIPPATLSGGAGPGQNEAASWLKVSSIASRLSSMLARNSAFHAIGKKGARETTMRRILAKTFNSASYTDTMNLDYWNSDPHVHASLGPPGCLPMSLKHSPVVCCPLQSEV